MVNWLQLLNQLNFGGRHTKIFMQNTSQWWLQKVQLLRTAVNWCWWRITHTFCHNSNILGCAHSFWLSRFGQFLSLFSQDNEYTELTVLLFFQNPYSIFAHTLQHYHDFQSNVAIFPSVVQAYIQPYSFAGRLKLINCQIRHGLSVAIHEISTGWK